MRDYQLRTPQKDFSLANRRPKSTVDHHKNLHKAGKKNSISELSSASADTPELDLRKDSLDFSSLSEISDETQLTESIENMIASVSPAVSPASAALASPCLTSLSTSNAKVYKNGTGCGSSDSRTTKRNCIEAEFVINHVMEARNQIRNAGDMDLQSKSLLDALVNVIIEDLKGMPEEKDNFNEQNSWKTYVICLSFLLWILALSASIFYFSGSKHAFRGATPT